MKKIKFLALMMLAGAMAFTSCKKDDDESTPAPTISFSGGTSVVVPTTKDTNVVFNAKISAEAKVSAFTITEHKYTKSGTDKYSEYDASATSKAKGEVNFTYNFDKTFNAASFNNADDPTDPFEKIQYVFSVTDKEGHSISKTYTVTLEQTNQGTPLSKEIPDGVIWNFIGPNKGAWDLVADVPKASTDASADKDMINTTTTASQAPETFEKEWKAGNATTFVKATESYDTFTTEEFAQGVYSEGTPMTKVSDVAVGDVYVAKLRGGGDYAVIKVTNVVVTTNDNKDKIEFKYKKK